MLTRTRGYPGKESGEIGRIFHSDHGHPDSTGRLREIVWEHPANTLVLTPFHSIRGSYGETQTVVQNSSLERGGFIFVRDGYCDPTQLFKRYDNNPILSRQSLPYPANAIMNPGAVRFEGGVLLLARVEDMRGCSHLTVLRSPDGKQNWSADRFPTLEPSHAYHEERWGIEDPRVVWLEEQKEYAVTYVSFSKGGPLVSLAMTSDFTSFRRLGPLLPPEDKDASLFPRQIKGQFALIHRPIIRGEAHIWIAFSRDLKYWGGHDILIPARPGSWDCHRVGLGPPPIETPNGWLVIYHGVRRTAAGSLYRVGLALLDLEEPQRVVRRSEEWVFGPQADYELTGDVPGVTFPTGVVVDEATRDMFIYYGAADSSIGLAVANLDEVLEYLGRCPNQERD